MSRLGLKIGRNCKIMERVVIDCSHCAHIEIGDDVVIAPEAYILAHDASTYPFVGHTAIGKVRIGDGAFIGARAIILPNVTVGDRSIVGAGAVVTRDVPPDTVVAGNPAVPVETIDAFADKHRKRLKTAPRFGEEYTQRLGVKQAMLDEMNRRMTKGRGYIK
ncbi:MAG: acyltransferase [Patescibacteria group bacterium]